MSVGDLRMSDAHAGFGKPSDGRWHRIGPDPELPNAVDIYADLRDIMAKLSAHEDADRTAMVVFIAAYYGWRLES